MISKRPTINARKKTFRRRGGKGRGHVRLILLWKFWRKFETKQTKRRKILRKRKKLRNERDLIGPNVVKGSNEGEEAREDDRVESAQGVVEHLRRENPFGINKNWSIWVGREVRIAFDIAAGSEFGIVFGDEALLPDQIGRLDQTI